jgi:hypothetical protein
MMDRRTDREPDMAKLKVAFLNFANAPNNANLHTTGKNIHCINAELLKQQITEITSTNSLVLNFKLSLCFECRMLSSGLFPGVSSLYAYTNLFL